MVGGGYGGGVCVLYFAAVRAYVRRPAGDVLYC